MQIIKVTDKQTRKLFHQVPHSIYKGDKNWAAPLEVMVENTFSPEKNPSFQDGVAERWILLNTDNQAIGRIASFIQFGKSKTYEQPTGGCGYFECINDFDAAKLLFDTAKEWLLSHGMEAMDGPINFGENYMNWGLLADGFMPQGYGMPYNPQYYEQLFRKYGFEVYFEQYSYHLDYTVPFPERFWKIAGWVAQKPGYHFEHFSYDKTEKFIQDFCAVYDGAWRFHEHFKPLDPQDLRDFLVDSKAVLDPEMIWFAYHENEPIAMFVMIPDINQILQKLNGKLNFVNMLKFMWYKKTKQINRARILIMGVVPKYQKSGIESAIFWHQDKLMKKKPQYTEIELSWAGDFNPKIIALYKSVGGVQRKTHYTMRYLFDRSKPFHRAPIIGAAE